MSSIAVYVSILYYMLFAVQALGMVLNKLCFVWEGRGRTRKVLPVDWPSYGREVKSGGNEQRTYIRCIVFGYLGEIIYASTNILVTNMCAKGVLLFHQ